MAAPSLVQAGTGQVYQTGTTGVTCSLSGATVGNIVVLHVLLDGGDSAADLRTVTNIENLAGTDSAMTRISPSPDNAVGSPTAAFQDVYLGRCLSTTPSVAVASSAFSVDCYFRLYEFADVSSGTTLATVIENSSAGAATNGAGTGTTISDTGVTTLGPDRLALNFIGVDDDDQASFDTEAFTGQSGGTWVSGGSYGSSTGTDGSIGLQYATMASAGTIDGGTLTIPSDNWGVIGFALVGTTSAVTLLPSPTNFGAHAIFQPTM